MTRRGTVAVALAVAVVAAVSGLLTAGRAPAASPRAPGAQTVASPAGATTLAGTGTPGYSGDGGAATRAQLDGPTGVAVDGSGDLFVADTGNCRVRAVPARTGILLGRQVRAGIVVTVAGGPCDDHPEPTAVAVDATGDLFVAYPAAARVDEVAAGDSVLGGRPSHPGAEVAVAGSGVAGEAGDGGAATRAQFDDPSGIAVDASGDLLIADTGNCRLRLVAASGGTRFGVPVAIGEAATVAGTGVCGPAGDGGPALTAQLWDPGALAVGPAGDVLIADQGNRTIRELAASDGTFYGVALAAGHLGTVAGEGSYGPYLVDGLPALGQTAELNFPSGLALDPAGDLYVSDGPMHAIRVVTAGPTTLYGTAVAGAAMVTAAGALSSGSLDNRTTWVRTRMTDPVGVGFGSSGRLVFADAGADLVRELPPAG